VSQTGTLVYSSGVIDIGRQFYWYDRQGKLLSKLGASEYSSEPQVSPDGKKLAFRLWTQPAGNFEIWVYDLARGVPTRASFKGLTAFAPFWSPDPSQVAYSHSAPQASGDHMFLMKADGTGTEESLEQPYFEAIANYPSSWSPDGKWLLFDHQEMSGKLSCGYCLSAKTENLSRLWKRHLTHRWGDSQRTAAGWRMSRTILGKMMCT